MWWLFGLDVKNHRTRWRRAIRGIAFAVTLLGLSLIGPAREEKRVQVALELVRELTPSDRAWAAHELGHLDPPDPGLRVPVLSALLADPASLVRARAAEGLSHFDGDAEVILKKLEPALHDADATVRACAFTAVSRLAPAGDSVETLKAGLRDIDPAIRKEAEYGLHRVSAWR
jgi:hypothetical protein